MRTTPIMKFTNYQSQLELHKTHVFVIGPPKIPDLFALYITKSISISYNKYRNKL
ncbi:hypothetical protein V1478_004415 [Vespula squamosa]|uniref:Uncharacterized protein n=1 Tax=Vespula squamosa TaxID=30214 RepID=A0ABD2BG36_VESSQ